MGSTPNIYRLGFYCRVTYIAQFLKEIKQVFEIPGPASTITLYQLKDGQEVEIKPTATLQSLQDAGKDGGAPLIVKSTAIEHSLTTVNLHIYAPKATKKFDTINVEIKSGKISVESLLKEYRWKRLYFLEFRGCGWI